MAANFGPQILARRYWPANIGLQILARKGWPANFGPQILARKYWPANFGPQILARKNLARRYWPANFGPQKLARKNVARRYWPAKMLPAARSPQNSSSQFYWYNLTKFYTKWNHRKSVRGLYAFVCIHQHELQTKYFNGIFHLHNSTIPNPLTEALVIHPLRTVLPGQEGIQTCVQY